MKVSVVIPAYNAERYVAEAIESVLAQTRPADEIVVVDDGSTDRTPAILDRLKPRILVVRQENSGPAAALNTAISRATGDHLAFNDADDLWVPEKLARQCALMSERPAIDAVFGAVRQFTSPDWRHEAPALEPFQQEQRGVCKAAMLIRRSSFNRIGPFDESFRIVDFVGWYGRAVLQSLRIHMLPEVLVLRRIHADNMGRAQRGAERSETLLALKHMLDIRRAGGRSASFPEEPEH